MYLVNPENSFQKVEDKGFFVNEKETARWMFSSGIPEISYINWIIENFKDPNKNFVDVGAHLGTYSWMLAPHFFHTHSFECNLEVYNCLCANIFLKGLSKKITSYPFGLSSESKESTYYLRSKDGGGNGFTYLGEHREALNLGEIQLSLKKMDQLSIENIGLIKIDAEGHEKEVLMGSIETLKRSDYPTLVFESWAEWREQSSHRVPAKKLRKELFTLIKEIGYRVVPIRGNDELFLAEMQR